MILNDSVNKTIIIENETLRCAADYSHGVKIKELSNRLSGIKSNRMRELVNLGFKGGCLTSADFSVGKVFTGEDKTRELASINLSNEQLGLYMRVHFLSNKKDTLNIIIQVSDVYKDGLMHKMPFHSPFLADMEYGGKDDVYYFPGCPVKCRSGKGVVRFMPENIAASDIKLPLVVCGGGGEGKYGFSVNFPSLSDLKDEGSTQNRNIMLSGISGMEDLKNHSVPLAPDDTLSDSIEFEITGIKNGWPEAFERCRENWRSNYDFSEYEKPDLKWFSECAVHNFSFLYGDAAFDRDSGKIDTGKILDEGAEFGGYDTVTVWNQYPRLGVDSRSQWDFYKDFPGGIGAFKEMTDEFHSKGVKVFLPYIPWDRGRNESDDSMGDNFEELIAKTGADGYQLDTMQSIPESFRKKLDKVRPGIVLTSQKHPMKKRPLEIITTSWDEFWDTDCMPRVDILRFICPCHTAPALSRWCRYEDKDKLIDYAVFGAEPIVVWQDIFGRWMPYSKQQKNRIKHWKQIYLEYRSVYQGMHPIPLYPVMPDGIYCNLFRDDRGPSEIYSFYSERGDDYDGALLRLADPKNTSSSYVIGSGTASINGGRLYARIPTGKVTHILVKR